jgi:hypothetical protein
MKYSFFLIAMLFAGTTFSQQKKINQHLESLREAGAFKIDTTGINGEKIDSVAHFPGGQQLWSQYIVRNHSLLLDVPRDKGVEDGKYIVWVAFTVNTDGTLTDIAAITKFGYGLEEGLIKLLKNSGKWIPATSDNINIASRVKLSQYLAFSSE